MEEKRGVYIFNPDTDIALSVDSVNYTPPSTIVRFMLSLALLPALYASEGSYIVIHPAVELLLKKKRINMERLPYYSEMREREISIISSSEITDCASAVIPWGWNKSLVSWLQRLGIASYLLPTNVQLDKFRSLSHRRITVTAHEFINNILAGDAFVKYRQFPPVECSDESILKSFLAKMGKCYLKAPWSSSGKGVFIYEDTGGLWSRAVKILHRQGSIMVEKLWDKVLDFATEWDVRNGRAQYLGLSIFKNEGESRYSGNIIDTQPHLESLLFNYVSPDDFRQMINAQKLFIENYLGPDYEGPLGIDSLVDCEGNLNPFVELNLRMTMGRVALSIAERSPVKGIFTPKFDLKI